MAIEEITVTGKTFSNILALPKSSKIGDIDIQTTIEESIEHQLEVTEHPVEQGAQITDHSYLRPIELTLRCGWSDSSLAALESIATGFFAGGKMSDYDYVSSVYTQLLNLQQSRQTFTVTTGFRLYTDLLMTSLRVDRDQRTANALMVTATFRQVILVSISSATLPAQTNQATPASTAETVNTGSQQVTTGNPSSGGSYNPVSN